MIFLNKIRKLQFVTVLIKYLHFILANAATRVKRQEDEGEDGQSTEELCQDRPGDEYFRLTTDGDCRDVVR